MLTKHSISPTLLDYNGARFKGEICGKWMSGRISVDDDGVYLCQNVVEGFLIVRRNMDIDTLGIVAQVYF